MRSAWISSVSVFFVVVTAAFGAGCPGDERAEGEGDAGEGEGEEGEGEEGEGEGVVLLSEISCQGGDWVEVFNPGSTAINLQAFAVTDDLDDPTHREPLFGTLEPGGRRAFDVASFGIGCDDTIELLENGANVDDTQLVITDGLGTTWSRLPEPIGTATPFAESFPTRGQPNQALTQGDVRINEVDCRGFERIELINAGDSAVDVGGFVVATDTEDPATRFTLPALSVPAGARFFVTEADGAAAGFEFNIDCNNGPLVLLDAAGTVIDSVVIEQTAEAFTWGRLPDGVGPFAANEPTIDDVNAPPVVLGARVFDPSRLATVSLTTTPACSFTYDADAALDCTVVDLGGGLRRVSFDELARFDGLEDIVLDTSNRDPSLARAIVGSALYNALGVPAARVGLAAISIDGGAAQNGLVVEVVEGRALKRVFASTANVYGAGAAAKDLVVADVAGFIAIDPADADRVDLGAAAAVLEPLRAGVDDYRAAADGALHVVDSLHSLAIDAWLRNSAGYVTNRTEWRVHFDDDGQGTLLPGDLSGVLADDAALVPAGGVVTDGCAADPDCQDALASQINDVDGAATALGVFLVDGVSLVDVVRAALGPAADTAALDAVAARLAARSAEVQAHLAAP